MRKRITLYASEGKVLTDGSVFCSEIQLAEGIDGSEFYEISAEEAEKMQTEKEDL